MVEWRAVESHRRWLAAVYDGLHVPLYPEQAGLVHLTHEADRSLVLSLEETYYLRAEDSRAYASVADGSVAEGCEPADRDVWSAVYGLEAVLFCPSRSSFEVLLAHPDGLVLRATVPAREDGGPDCDGLRVLSSLVPLHAEARPCRGRCEHVQGILRSSWDGATFETRTRPGPSHMIIEVVSFAEPRFSVSVADAYDPPPRAAGVVPSALDLFGSRFAAEETTEEDATLRTAWITGHRAGNTRVREFGLVITLAGRGAAFERGSRFLDALAPSAALAQQTLHGASPTEPPREPSREVAEPIRVEPRAPERFLVVAGTLVVLLVIVATLVRTQ